MAPVVMISPGLVDVFLRHILRNLMVASVGARFALAGRHVLLKVAIDDFVGDVPEKVDFSVGPLVQINGLDRKAHV